MVDLYCNDRIMRILIIIIKIFFFFYLLKFKIREGINIGGMEWGWERVKDRFIVDIMCVDRMMRILIVVSLVVLLVIRAGLVIIVNLVRRIVFRFYLATNRDFLIFDI